MNKNVIQKNETVSMKALTDALSACLWILKKIMILMVIFFLFSGVFWVEEGTIAFQMRWGKICQNDGQTVILPGGPYFGFPDPIEKRIKIPTSIQTLTLNESFWNDTTNQNQSENNLVMGLLTADKNIVHGKWTISFSVGLNLKESNNHKNALLFFKNVGSIEKARDIVKLVAERAIVHTTAQTTVDEFIRGKEKIHIIKEKMQSLLIQMETGLNIHSVSQKAYSVPKHLNFEFQAVNRAESQKALKIEESKRYCAMMLNQTAGRDYIKIIQAINNIESTNQSEKKKYLEKHLKKYFLSELLGGMAAEVINTAKIYRTSTLENIQAAAINFQRLLKTEKEHSNLLRNRMIQDCLENIFSKKIQSIVLPKTDGSHLIIEN